ncbi:hypothetical protein [Amorphus sp. 3PC139-8]|uniref:hypothetical protein n=1 Tax=Amorphus sp. 3PC139-8 TaxID=2735676 RepID=UPI00345D7759
MCPDHRSHPNPIRAQGAPSSGPDSFGPDITLQELQEALAEEGYSADARKDWLRALLTEVQSRYPKGARIDRAALIEAVKEVIDTHQQRPSVIDDDDGKDGNT